MSNKKRRDITLGEMQDECKRRNRDCMAHTNCEYRWYCDPILNATEFDSITPLSNDLTDPTRFNEQQMAFWRGWYAVGARTALCCLNGFAVNLMGEKPHEVIAGFTTGAFDCGLSDGETLDLAELLGKDGAE